MDSAVILGKQAPKDSLGYTVATKRQGHISRTSYLEAVSMQLLTSRYWRSNIHANVEERKKMRY